MADRWLKNPQVHFVAAVLVIAGGFTAYFLSGSADASTGKPDGNAAETSETLVPTRKRRAEEDIRHAAKQSVLSILRGSDADRARAIAVLKNLGDEGLQLLREEFDNRYGTPRGAAAAFALAHVGKEEDFGAVAAAFREQKHEIHGLMALAAARLGNSGVSDEMRDLRGNKDPVVRRAVAIALRTAAVAHPGELLELAADPEPRVQNAAQMTLLIVSSKLDPRELKKAATEAANSSKPMLRATGIKIGAQMKAPWALELAAKGTRDKDMRVRLASIQSLGKLGDGRAASTLSAIMQTGRNRRERVKAANALAEVPVSKGTLDDLAKTAARGDPIVGLAAARVLAVNKDRRAIPALLKLRSVK
ncbi:MAG: HEAT repeat domain-containing protein, partial [Planctomycetota bacterium]